METPCQRGMTADSPLDPASLWDEYRPRLIVFVRNFGGIPADSPEDIAHDIIERAMKRSHQFDGVHAFSTWLYRLARNHCIDVSRNRKRRREIFNRNAAALRSERRVFRGPQEQLDRSETAAAIAAAIARLKPRDRQIAFLRYFEEFPIAEISDVMGMPTGTVKCRLHVVLDLLRRDLEGELS